MDYSFINATSSLHVLLFGFLNTPSKIYKSARINSTYHFKFSKLPLRLIDSFEISKVFIALCVHFIGFKVWLSFNLINDSFRSASSPFRMARLDFGRFPSRCVRRQNVAFAIATLSVNKLNVVWSVLLWTILFCSALFRVFFYFAVDDDGLLAEFGTQKSIRSMILYVIIMKGFSRGNPKEHSIYLTIFLSCIRANFWLSCTSWLALMRQHLIVFFPVYKFWVFLYRLGANFLTQLGFRTVSLVLTFWPTWHSGLGRVPVPPLFSSPICIVINF